MCAMCGCWLTAKQLSDTDDKDLTDLVGSALIRRGVARSTVHIARLLLAFAEAKQTSVVAGRSARVGRVVSVLGGRQQTTCRQHMRKVDRACSRLLYKFAHAAELTDMSSVSIPVTCTSLSSVAVAAATARLVHPSIFPRYHYPSPSSSASSTPCRTTTPRLARLPSAPTYRRASVQASAASLCPRSTPRWTATMTLSVRTTPSKTSRPLSAAAAFSVSPSAPDDDLLHTQFRLQQEHILQFAVANPVTYASPPSAPVPSTPSSDAATASAHGALSLQPSPTPGRKPPATAEAIDEKAATIVQTIERAFDDQAPRTVLPFLKHQVHLPPSFVAIALPMVEVLRARKPNTGSRAARDYSALLKLAVLLLNNNDTTRLEAAMLTLLAACTSPRRRISARTSYRGVSSSCCGRRRTGC